MNIPQAQIDLAKKALRALWEDKATISRKQKVGNVPKDTVIYKDILCSLSQSSQPLLEQSSTIATTTSIFTLYVDTDILIKQGDAIVITHKNQVFNAIAGQSFNRNFSNSVKLEVKAIS